MRRHHGFREPSAASVQAFKVRKGLSVRAKRGCKRQPAMRRSRRAQGPCAGEGGVPGGAGGAGGPAAPGGAAGRPREARHPARGPGSELHRHHLLMPYSRAVRAWGCSPQPPALQLRVVKALQLCLCPTCDRSFAAFSETMPRAHTKHVQSAPEPAGPMFSAFLRNQCDDKCSKCYGNHRRVP